MPRLPRSPSTSVTRRRVCAAALAAPWLAACATKPEAPTLIVGALFAGQRNDGGFMEAGWRGLERAQAELGARIRFIDGVPPQTQVLAGALSRLAAEGAQLVIAHGGQNNEAAEQAARQHPHTWFVVTQGAVSATNLASYDVLQEESAYLAGVLAALSTRSGVVGHMSGIRVRPGLKGRAAYAAGVRDTNPAVRLLTNFSGHQDDNALSYRVAQAQIAAGADVIFTMLNAGREGATRACREHGARQIGNVADWVARDPQVFIGSALADVGRGVFNAVADLRAHGAPQAGIHRIGLADAAAVNLSIAPDVPATVRERIAAVRADIMAGRRMVPLDYEGPEFSTPA